MSDALSTYKATLQSDEMRAFLHVIRTGEGTLGEDGYRTMFGGGLFSSFVDHPRKKITKLSRKKPITSTAAGAYQFLERTWDAIAEKYGLSDFSPENQDVAAVALIAGRGALDDVLAGRVESALAKCNKEWASLPGSPYGQPTLSLGKALARYEAELARLRGQPARSVEVPPARPIRVASSSSRLFGLSFAEWLSAFFVIAGYGFGVAVVFFTNLSDELKAAIVAALVVQAISDVRGFHFGASSPKEERK